jgi:hypothetical protein
MFNDTYFIAGQDGIWKYVSWHEFDDTIVLVFRNLGSGRLLEVELDIFSYLANNKQFQTYGV